MSGFKAFTWNVFHGSTPDNLADALHRLQQMGCTLGLVQELSAPTNRAMFADAGWRLGFTPRQYAVVWLPSLWVEVNRESLRLSQTPYWSPDADGQQYSDAASVILSDRQGRTLDAVSYHTPSGVQTSRNAPRRRQQATSESFDTLAARAKAAQTRACLYGGDDNVDERRGAFRWLTNARGLRQVQAPGATHGKRRIDDFRVRGLVVGSGSVVPVPAPDDHHIHVRSFGWA